MNKSNSRMEIRLIPLEKIIPDPGQPRKSIKAQSIERMAQTIKEKGVLHPILLDKDMNIIVGYRRFLASKKAGFKKIPAIIKDIPSEERLEFQLIENIHSEHLPVLEKAEAIAKLKESRNLTNEQLAGLIGITERHLYRLSSLRNAPREMVNALKDGKISATHLMAIRSLPGEKQRERFRKFLSINKLSKTRICIKHSRPRDLLRKAGLNMDVSHNTMFTSLGEGMKHFLIKSMVFKLLRDRGKTVCCEAETSNGIADIINLNDRIVYELESEPSPSRVKKKIEQFPEFEDVFILNLREIPDRLEAAEQYLKRRLGLC